MYYLVATLAEIQPQGLVYVMRCPYTNVCRTKHLVDIWRTGEISFADGSCTQVLLDPQNRKRLF